MSSLTLSKVSCDNCGAELVFNPTTQLTNCNFCGSEFQIEKKVEEEVILPDNILPFSIQSDEYEKNAMKWLSEGDYTPDDILNSSVFEKSTGTYLPMWFFSGRYSGNWSASSGYRRIEEYIGRDSNGRPERKTRTVTDWRPSNGQIAGSYSVLGFAGKGVKSDISTYAEGTGFKRGQLKKFDSKYTLGFNMLEFKIDEHDCWDDRGAPQVNSIAKDDAKRRVPGDTMRDFICDVTCDQELALKAYVPFWITNYQYGGKNFHVYMDGTSNDRITGVRPIDQERKKAVRKKFYKGHISLVIWLITVIAIQDSVSQDDFDVINGTLIVLTIVLYIIGYYQKQKLINESKERRKKSLENLS